MLLNYLWLKKGFLGHKPKYISKKFMFFPALKNKTKIIQKLIFKFKIYGAKLIDKFYKSPKINLVLILFGSSVLECCLDVHRKIYV